MRANNKMEIRFPVGHPIWSYPDGERPSKVRELVDMALRIGNVLDEIKSVVGDIQSKMVSGAQISNESATGERSVKVSEPSEGKADPPDICSPARHLDEQVVKSFLDKFKT